MGFKCQDLPLKDRRANRNGKARMVVLLATVSVIRQLASSQATTAEAEVEREVIGGLEQQSTPVPERSWFTLNARSV